MTPNTSANVQYRDLQRRLERYYLGRGRAVRIGPPTRLVGGYDTDVFKVTITDGAGTNVRALRRYPPDQPDHKPTFEGLVQNALHDRGFPAPRVLDVCTDKSIIGGAFIVMEFAEGRQLLHAPDHVQSTLLGRTHARLHGIDAAGVYGALSAVDAERFLLEWRLSRLEAACARDPGLRETVDWIMKHRPGEESLSVCHGDFHKLNVLCDDDNEVTAVLDWSAVAIAEPEFDIAHTMLIFGTLAKYLTDDFAPADHDRVVADYLQGYRTVRPIDAGKLEYYSVVQAAMGIVSALDGHEHWSRPGLVEELEGYVTARVH